MTHLLPIRLALPILLLWMLATVIAPVAEANSSNQDGQPRRRNRMPVK